MARAAGLVAAPRQVSCATRWQIRCARKVSRRSSRSAPPVSSPAGRAQRHDGPCAMCRALPAAR
eukprot:1909476-Prymnesium_polylepis.1